MRLSKVWPHMSPQGVPARSPIGVFARPRFSPDTVVSDREGDRFGSCGHAPHQHVHMLDVRTDRRHPYSVDPPA